MWSIAWSWILPNPFPSPNFLTPYPYLPKKPLTAVSACSLVGVPSKLPASSIPKSAKVLPVVFTLGLLTNSFNSEPNMFLSFKYPVIASSTSWSPGLNVPFFASKILYLLLKYLLKLFSNSFDITL